MIASFTPELRNSAPLCRIVPQFRSLQVPGGDGDLDLLAVHGLKIYHSKYLLNYPFCGARIPSHSLE